MSTFIISGQGLVVVTQDDGTIAVLPGFPTQISGAQTLAPALLNDADSLLAPASVGGTAALLPALISDADAVYAATTSTNYTLTAALFTDSETFSIPSIGAPSQTLTAGLYTDSDTFYAPRQTFILDPWGFIDEYSFVVEYIYAPSIAQILLQTLLPGSVTDVAIEVLPGDIDNPPGHGKRRFRPPLVTDSDFIFANAIGASVKPALVPADDAVYAAASITAARRPALVPSDDAVYAFTSTRFLLPIVVASDDNIAAADVGWQVIAELTTDNDAVYSDIGIFLWNDMLPETYADEESTATYPFKVQFLTGGIPVPRPIGLTGSLSQPIRLTGSLSQRRRLKGSIASTRRLTGSIGPRIGKRKR